MVHADLTDAAAVDELSEAQLVELRRLHVIMRSVFRRHVHPPSFLAARELSLLMKTQAFLHSISLESVSVEALDGWTCTVGSFTVDMGTEVGMGLLPSIPTEQVLQSWRYTSPLVLEDVGGGVPIVADIPAPRVEACAANFFPYAVVIPGVMHLFHNLRGALLQSLTSWKEGVEKRLKSVARWLSSWNNLVRLKRTCFVGMEFMFDKQFKCVPLFIEWKWGSICRTLSALLPLRAALQINWSYQKYIQGGAHQPAMDAPADRGDDHGPDQAASKKDELLQDLQTADGAIADDSFWVAAHVVQRLNQVLAHMEGWCNGCPCHGPMFEMDSLGKYHRCVVYQKLVGSGNGDFCPFAGCRAPEIAKGKLTSYTQDIIHMATVEITVQVLRSVPDVARDDMLRQWHTGLGVILAGLAEKLAFWDQLPHSLVGLASFDDAVVKATASSCLQQFSRTAADLHHPLSSLFCDPAKRGGFYSAMVAIAAGEPLDSRSSLFRVWARRMRYLEYSRNTNRGETRQTEQDHAEEFAY